MGATPKLTPKRKLISPTEQSEDISSLVSHILSNQQSIVPQVTNTFTISGGTPTLYLVETDQTDPAGRWRLKIDTDVLYLEGAATSAWATDNNVATFTRTGTNLELTHATNPELKFTEVDQTDPAGRWKIEVDTDTFYIMRAATASWATETAILTLNASGLLSFPSTGQIRGNGISIQPNVTSVGDRVLFKGIDQNATAVTVAAITNHETTPKFTLYQAILQTQFDANLKPVSQALIADEVTSAPTAASTQRGRIIRVRSADGQPTTIQVCVVNSAVAYEWVTIGTST